MALNVYFNYLEPPPQRLPSILRAAMAGDVKRMEELVWQGVELDLVVDDFGNTLLHKTVEGGHKEAVKFMLQAGADPHEMNESYNDALHTALLLNKVDVARTIWPFTRKRHSLPLHAAALGMPEDAQRPADRRNLITAVDGGGFTALHVAACVGNIPVALMLIASGADKEAKAKNGWTPLYMACANGHELFARAMLDAGANVNGKTKFGTTPLHAACYRDHAACALVLLRAGAEIDMKARGGGETPLHVACERGAERCMRVLLDAGANVNALFRGRALPLHIACVMGRDVCVRMLVDAGSQMFPTDGPWLAPLILASMHGQDKCVRQLLELGASKDEAEGYGMTALHIACENKHVQCIRVLVGAGACLNLKNLKGSTPLALIISIPSVDSTRAMVEAGDEVHLMGPTELNTYKWSLDCMRVLVEAGASVVESDATGATPLFEYRHARLRAFVSVLLSAGAHRGDELRTFGEHTPGCDEWF